MFRYVALAVALAVSLATTVTAADAKPIRVLFLGDNGHHRPADRFRQIEPVLTKRGIELTYSDRLESLNPDTLAGYDGLLIYANFTALAHAQERALLDFVAGVHHALRGWLP